MAEPQPSRGTSSAPKGATKAAHVVAISTPSAAKSDIVHQNLFTSAKGVQKAVKAGMPVVLLTFKAYDASDTVIHSVLQPLMDEFKDVFPEEIPSGLPPIRGIEHQIDFQPGAILPNRPAYRLDLPGEYKCFSTFNVSDLSPFPADDVNAEEELNSRSNSFEERGNDETGTSIEELEPD